MIGLTPVTMPGEAQTARWMSFEGANFPAPAIPLLDIRTRAGMTARVGWLGGIPYSAQDKMIRSTQHAPLDEFPSRFSASYGRHTQRKWWLRENIVEVAIFPQTHRSAVTRCTPPPRCRENELEHSTEEV